MTAQRISLKTIESAEFIRRNIELKFSEDSKAKSCNVVYFPPIFSLNNYYITVNIAIFHFIVVIKTKKMQINSSLIKGNE